MRQELFTDHAIVYLTDDTVIVRDDRTHAGLVIGYGNDGKIVRLTFMNPKKRRNMEQVAIVERYDPEADALDIELDEDAWHETEESPLGFLIDYDADHCIVALEFLGASKLFPEAVLTQQFRAA